MNVLHGAAVGAAMLLAGAGAALGATVEASLPAPAGDPCCIVASVGPGGRAVMVESVATRHRWLYYLTGANVVPGTLPVGARVDFDPLAGRLFGLDHEPIAGALVTAAN